MTGQKCYGIYWKEDCKDVDIQFFCIQRSDIGNYEIDGYSEQGIAHEWQNPDHWPARNGIKFYENFTPARCFAQYCCRTSKKFAKSPAKKKKLNDLIRLFAGKDYYKVQDVPGIDRARLKDYAESLKKVDPVVNPLCKFWVEQYWPSHNRDLSVLYLWFNEKRQNRIHSFHYGDRVLFYETGHHPTSGLKGSKTIFASGTVLDEVIPIPEAEQLRGGKRWLFKRLVRPDYAVAPEDGLSLEEVKQILCNKGWTQSGFNIDPDKFQQIERKLKERQESVNNRRVEPEDAHNKPYTEKAPSQFQSSGKAYNETNRLLALERSANTHKDLLNKLNQTINNHRYKTTEDQKVDLFADISSVRWIFEVKSTNDDNFLAQIRRGVAQLYEYRFLYARKEENINLCLVVQTLPPQELSWVTEYLQSLKIHLCWSVPNGFHTAWGTELEFLSHDSVTSDGL